MEVQKERYEPEVPAKDVPWLEDVFDSEIKHEALVLDKDWATDRKSVV